MRFFNCCLVATSFFLLVFQNAVVANESVLFPLLRVSQDQSDPNTHVKDVGSVALPSTGLVHHLKKKPSRKVNPYPIPKRIDFAHREGKGIGYMDGYSKLGMLIAPEYKLGEFLPLIDLRGILFDNGNWAANAGLVGRFLRKQSCQVIGINLFYDYRSTSWGGFNQIGGGFEVLNRRWEVHGNAYFPISAKEYHKTCNFDDYIGDYQAQVKRYKFAAKYAFDGEYGYYIAHLHNFQIYAAAGLYFFKHECDAFTTGIQAKLRPQFADYLAIELSVSHDQIYDTIFQINVTFTIPLYDYSSAIKKKKGPCGMPNWQIYQPVSRQEIIQLSKICHWKYNWAD